MRKTSILNKVTAKCKLMQGCERKIVKEKQVDILISKNQVLQILYLKHIKLHKLPWIETHKNLKLNNDTVQFYCYIKQKHTL